MTLPKISADKLNRLRAFLFLVRDGLPHGTNPEIGVGYTIKRQETGRVIAILEGVVETKDGLADSFCVDFADSDPLMSKLFRRLAK